MKKRILTALLFAFFLFALPTYAQYTVTLVAGTPGSSRICSETTVTLVATTNYTGAAQGYTWMGSSFSSPVYQSSVVVGPGTYTVIGGSVQGIALAPHYFVVGPCTGLRDHEDGPSTLAVFPNPVNDVLRFRIGDPEMTNLVLEIRDLSGRVIFADWHIDPRSDFDVSFLDPGLYSVTLKSGEEQRMFKLLKQTD